MCRLAMRDSMRGTLGPVRGVNGPTAGTDLEQPNACFGEEQTFTPASSEEVRNTITKTPFHSSTY